MLIHEPVDSLTRGLLMTRAGMRLDQWLTAHGQADTRSRAKWLIEDGQVWVDGKPYRHPSAVMPKACQVEVRGRGLPYVGRGGLKLEHALKTFSIEVAALVAFDVGASTGGFTDCLLQHGSQRVYALDVGTGQLHPSLRQDARVISLEGRNIRTFQAVELPELVDLVTVDLSFISLSLVLPLLPPFLRPRGQVLALIKPEFEVGRAYVGRGGIVRDITHRKLAVCRVLEAALGVGFQVVQTTDAPRWQARGNQEVFAYLGWSQ